MNETFDHYWIRESLKIDILYLLIKTITEKKLPVSKRLHLKDELSKTFR